MKGLLFLALAALALTVAGLTPSVAHAVCQDPPCLPEYEEEEPPPDPAPITTTITGISPSFAWSGDTITLTGTGFTGASVSINGLAATISSRTSTRLTVTVPTITNTIAGPVSIPVLVSSPTGTASTSFTLSPTLQLFTSATYGVNAQFGQGHDGSAWASATLDRSSGFVVSTLTVRNTQSWLSLSINMSTAWVDGNGTVIGFTTPEQVSSRGWMFSWPTGDTTATRTFTQVVGPNPGVAPFSRSARIILVRDHEAELLNTLGNAVSTGQSIGSVVSKLAPFFV